MSSPSRRFFLKGLLGSAACIGITSQVRHSVTLPSLNEAKLALKKIFDRKGSAQSSSEHTQIRQESSIPNKQISRTEEESLYADFINTLGLRYISPNELIAPHRKKRSNVSNEIPPRHLWQNMVKTLQVADEMRHRLGVPLRVIVSAYRSPAYNATCRGAAKRSTHLQNQALDLIFDCAPEQAARVAEQLRNEGYFKGGIGTYSSFVHIDTRGRNATW